MKREENKKKKTHRFLIDYFAIRTDIARILNIFSAPFSCTEDTHANLVGLSPKFYLVTLSINQCVHFYDFLMTAR